MPKPTVEPSSLSLRIQPGETRSAHVTIVKAPTAASVTASLVNGNSLITLKQVLAIRVFQRRLTEEEINELPPLPPSIRKKAGASTVTEHEEIGRTDGNTPLAVTAGDMLQIVVESSAPAQPALDVIAATLVIQGTTWDPAEVPIFLLIGPAAALPVIEPTVIRRSAEPGETLPQDLVIAKAPTTAKMVAWIVNGGAIIRLKQVIAFLPVKRKFTAEEIDELPPYPPEIRKEAQQNGYIEYQEVARSNGLTPLAVTAGHMVRLYVEFAAPASNFPDIATATLVVEGTTWKRVEVPLELIIGKVTVALSASSLALRQGESGDLSVTATSVAGPATEVQLQFGMDGGQWRVEPSTFFLARGGTLTAALKVHVDPKAPLGTFPVGLDVRSFERIQFRRFPFELKVKPALVTARLLQSAATATQGGKATCQVEITSHGGYNVITLGPGSLPAGVSLPPVVRELSYGASTTVIPVEFVVAPDARPVFKSLAGIIWSTGDSEHRGTLFLDLTIDLPPESRTFSHTITTPAGTALGGWAEITIRTDSSYTFRGHMHDSGFDPYAFRVRVVVRSASGTFCVAALKSGKVYGALGSGSRDYDWEEHGTNPMIRRNWAELRTGTAEFGKWYENTGVLGTLEDIAVAVGEFFATAVVVGPFVAAAIVIGSELGALTEVPFLHPTVLAGVGVAGGIVMLLGPGFILPAIVAGVLVGAQVKARPLRESEERLARMVFGDTLPFGRMMITNFDRDGRAFCIPHADGSILICLGDRYDDPIADKARARTFIHELTHAWQIGHMPVAAELAWDAAINEIKGTAETYKQRIFDGREWHDYEIETQAMIVDEWWYLCAALATPEEWQNGTYLETAFALNFPAFRYIQNNIRLGEL